MLYKWWMFLVLSPLFLLLNVHSCIIQFSNKCNTRFEGLQESWDHSNHRLPTQAATLVVCSKYKEMNGWVVSSRFTFILSFNLDIPPYKFTISRLFNILPYISLYFQQTNSPLVWVPSVQTFRKKRQT